MTDKGKRSYHDVSSDPAEDIPMVTCLGRTGKAVRCLAFIAGRRHASVGVTE